jgi:hypothetical protein
MKLATYHRGKKDYVRFYKGKAPYTTIAKFDRVYITTLFTFYYAITVDTVRHYLNHVHQDNVFVGGISATLLREQYIRDLRIENVIAGQLHNSSVLGYDDGVDIDALPLDYDILDDVSYQYPAGDNIFLYTTRGCPRGCEFCAVSTLEPTFKDTNSLVAQVTAIREKYGDKRNILIMDNNILFSGQLQTVVQDLNALGYIENARNYRGVNCVALTLDKIKRRRGFGSEYSRQIAELVEYLHSFQSKVVGKELARRYAAILAYVDSARNKLSALNKFRKELIEITEKYRFKTTLQRYVDFNQGLDARLLTDKKMAILSKIAIKPFRLAYDKAADEPVYRRAFEAAYTHGVRYFSNYMLYNYTDAPYDLWRRLHSTIELYEGKPDVQAFSFPMKYAPVDATDREFIGDKWNRKYLSAINVIVNVTKGVVAKEKDFFYEAFGHDKKEFLEILTMPSEFIRHRMLFKEHGYLSKWKRRYRSLDARQRRLLLDYLCGSIDRGRIRSKKLLSIIELYTVTKHALVCRIGNGIVSGTLSPGNPCRRSSLQLSVPSSQS